MARLILVCGPTGVGKTTYSLSLAKEIAAIKFSIDPWMQTLFSKDMTSLDFEWMMERVNRCSEQIWEVSQQILAINGNVILDLGFTTKEQRDVFANRAREIGLDPEIHYLNASTDIRKQRVNKRNTEKDPSVYAFEVTDMMFNFMEPRFEVPDEDELKNGRRINA
jgi:predicted kinase